MIKHKNSNNHLTTLKNLIPTKKIYIINLQKKPIKPQINILKILIKKQIINTFIIIKNPNNKKH